jgi:hypothetical protein
MEPRVSFILTMIALYVLLAIIMIVVTAKTAITKDRKIVVYILSIVSPFIGIIAYLIFRFSKKNEVV